MKKREIFWGLLFIIAAVLIILNQFGFFAGQEISMFKIAATVVLGGIMLKSITWLNFWGIFFPAAFLCILYSEVLNIETFTPWPALLTALLLSIGFSILFKRSHFAGLHFHHNHSNHNSFSSTIVNEKDEGVINCSTSFGECIKYVNTDNFERANISCSFGDVKVYFDNASIPSGKAEIYLDVSFGDAILYIPKTWKVISEVKVFLGDMKSYNPYAADAPVVTIYGNVSFGDAKIIYV